MPLNPCSGGIASGEVAEKKNKSVFVLTVLSVETFISGCLIANNLLTDLLNGIRSSKFSPQETDEITDFLKRAYVRLNAWFQWFNSTQSGNDVNTFYWHGRDNATTKELNPKVWFLASSFSCIAFGI
ncbi:hypothetical protein ZIOFF_064527 [Zingiber officinale]|uniref:Glycosyl hydrolase family 63 C-terminal domain-containing protein n=1 Tax=Zingiber officinale TaxID=94328 RepID=A0A8J5EW38_ZINOF|nr:hypothetical protein ZIOFF_064527 [Zingiber officinale]